MEDRGHVIRDNLFYCEYRHMERIPRFARGFFLYVCRHVSNTQATLQDLFVCFFAINRTNPLKAAVPFCIVTIYRFGFPGSFWAAGL